MRKALPVLADNKHVGHGSVARVVHEIARISHGDQVDRNQRLGLAAGREDEGDTAEWIFSHGSTSMLRTASSIDDRIRARCLSGYFRDIGLQKSFRFPERLRARVICQKNSAQAPTTQDVRTEGNGRDGEQRIGRGLRHGFDPDKTSLRALVEHAIGTDHADHLQRVVAG